MGGGGGTAEFLLVQRDPVDVLLIRDQFAASKVVNRLHAVPDARTAIAYLDGTTPYTHRCVSDAVLLDMDLPDSHDLLRYVGDRPDEAAVPIILLTGSPAEERHLRSRDYRVSGYATKPVDFDTLVSVVAAVPGLGFEVQRNRRLGGR